MGPIARAMLERLHNSPDGESGFRPSEIGTSAIKNGWVKQVMGSGIIKWFAITDTGREAYLRWRDKQYRRGV